MKTRKAISPVVATALLLVVAVVSVVGFSTWMNTYSSSTFVDVETKSSSQAISIESVSGNYLYVKNSNTVNETIDSINVGGVDCNIAKELIPGINKVDIGSCLNNAGPTNIFLVSDSGTVEKEFLIKNLGPINCIDMSNGLLSLWHFNNSWIDSSSNNFDGSAINGATFSSTSKIGNYSGSFSGANQYVNIPHNNLLNPNGNDFSFSFWARNDLLIQDSGDINLVFSKGVSSVGNAREYHAGFRGGSGYNGFYFRYRFGVGAMENMYCNLVNVTSIVNDNNWHFYTISIDEGASVEGKLYVDGSLCGTRDNFTISINPLESFLIGRYATWYFDGLIDEFSIYNRSLNSDEINQLYNYGNLGIGVCNP